jgi:hypothetical protein
VVVGSDVVDVDGESAVGGFEVVLFEPLSAVVVVDRRVVAENRWGPEPDVEGSP